MTFLGIGLFALCSGCTTIEVWRDDKVLLPVIVAADSPPAERAAAEELGGVLGRMSGLPWPVRAAAYPGEHGFYVGAPSGANWKRAVNPLSPGPGESGPDDFRILTRSGSVFITGATPEATGHAVAWLLQSQAGVRWYAPGAIGEVMPTRPRWALPALAIQRSPAYLSREIYGTETVDGTAWAQHNGLRGRFEHQHALSRLFTGKVLGAHPDWASRPKGRAGQPNLARPAVAEFAADAAATAFAADRDRFSFSLGMNDTVCFDQGAATRSLVEPLRYFRGRPDYSPLVFTFMNRAAGALAGKYPDRTLGCLAYFWCENVPPFPVHRNVVPYLTTDRTQYYDAAYRSADLALMSRWGVSGVQAFGLWEYGYGRGFLVPRLPLAALAAAVREGWHRGARGYMAEVEPQPGFDAFKVWMLAQLLWEPDRPVRELADDFYPGYYGPAAKAMRRFAERCEEQWMRQAGAPCWIKYFLQEDQALLFPAAVCRELRVGLAAAADAVKTDPGFAARVEQTARAFAVTEAYQQFDGLRRKLAAWVPGNSREENADLANAIGALAAAESGFREKLQMAQSGDSPAMTEIPPAAFLRNDPVPRLLGLAGRGDQAAPRRILAAAGPEALTHADWRLFAEVLADEKLRTAPNLAANSSFAAATGNFQEPRFLYPQSGPLPAKWEVQAMPTETGKVVLVGDGAGQAARALRIEGAWDTQVYQWIPAEPDCLYVASAQLRGRSSPGNDSALFLSFLKADGQLLGTTRMEALPKGTTVDWRTMVLAGLTPEDVAWVGIGTGCTRQQPGDWLEATAVELRGVVQASPP